MMKEMANQLIKAIKEDDIDTLKFLFFKNKSLGNLRVNVDGDTPLILSLREKSRECTNFLISNTDLSLKNYSGIDYKSFIDKESDSEYLKINHIIEVTKDKTTLNPYIKNNKNKKNLIL